MKTLEEMREDTDRLRNALAEAADWIDADTDAAITCSLMPDVARSRRDAAVARFRALSVRSPRAETDCACDDSSTAEHPCGCCGADAGEPCRHRARSPDSGGPATDDWHRNVCLTCSHLDRARRDLCVLFGKEWSFAGACTSHHGPAPAAPPTTPAPCTIAAHKAVLARGERSCPDCGGRLVISLPDREGER